MASPAPKRRWNEPQLMPPMARLLLVIYGGMALGSFAAVYGSYGYARSFDPWMTPRMSQSIMFWRNVSDSFRIVSVLGVLFCPLLAAISPALRQSFLFWLSLILFVLSFHFGIQ